MLYITYILTTNCMWTLYAKGNRLVLYSLLHCIFFYEAICCMSFRVSFSVLLVLRLPRLGKRELILVLFVRLFGLCLFRFVGFLFLLGSGKGCGLWLWHSLDFSLTFFVDWLCRCAVQILMDNYTNVIFLIVWIKLLILGLFKRCPALVVLLNNTKK